MNMDRENANRGVQAGSQDEAEQWFARLLDRNCPPEQHAAFERWRNADPAHAQAYRELELLWKRSEEATRDPAVMAAARRALLPEPGTRAPRRWAFPVLAAGLAILVAVVALPRWLSTSADPAGTAYSTAAGQQRTVQLADGSSILLDTDSQVSVRYSSRTRRVDLLHGQAQFTVQGNHAWPFVVHAGSGTVTAVGTQFQVRLNDACTGVALLKGKLAIATQAADGTTQTASLIGGESLGFDQAGHISPVHPLDLQQAQGWTQGKLFVHDWRLQQLLQEMNRYSSTKLAIGDPSLQNIHISGIFRTSDQQTFLLLLQQGWAIHARRVNHAQIVLSR
ncbi:FecR family protein [Dyella flagellata]|uniref:Sensor n=1 Tax=Dyella flagellata TaxID=1867833 RepID=A0ABQ5XGQ7_9GAMM|nr:FecR domain-containing protein [Dyella flagellata]GLQ90742.1 sensor [Dyella flagellata]